MTNLATKHESLFEQLAGAMALDGNHAPMTASAQEEAAKLNCIVLPALTLPARRRPSRHFWQSPEFLLLAAALVAIVGGRAFFAATRDSDVMRIKGPAVVKLYWERAGSVSTFKPDTALLSGDRVLAEVMTPKPAIAYWGVANSRGDLLGTWGEVQASRMALGPGGRQTFPTSLQLVGRNEGETIFVLVCDPNVVDPFNNLPNVKDVYLSNIKNCSGWKFQLR